MELEQEAYARNVDLFRVSLRTMDRQAIARALSWLHDKARYPFPRPASIHLDLTLRCTARCLPCRQWTWPSRPEFTVSQLEKLLDIFEAWGVQTITLGGGNPLLYDNAILAIQRANLAHMQVGIITEGIEMTDDLADAICNYARWIRFSLDGPTPSVHDKIRNAPGIFDQVITNIKKLQSRHSQLHIGLNCIVQKKNLNTLSSMIDLAEHIGVDALLFKVPHGEDHNGQFLLSAGEWARFVEWVHTNVSERTTAVMTNLSQLGSLLDYIFHKEDAVRGRPVRGFYAQRQIHCFAPLFFLSCDSEGNLFPCDYLQADTRPWNRKYGEMRSEFCLGNALKGSQRVLDNLAAIFQNKVHGLPASGYEECGSCTRFCQLNTVLDQIYVGLGAKGFTEQTLAEYLPPIADRQPRHCFL